MKKTITTLSLSLSASLFSVGADTYTLQDLRPRSQSAENATAFKRFTPEETGLLKKNEYNDPRMWGQLFRELTLGALETGVAVADFDKDGRLDIYSVSKNGPCSLYLQVVDYRFRDIAAVAGVAADDSIDGKAGATAVDINQDGWMDIYLCRYDAPNLLFVNNRNDTFTERAAEYGLDINDASVHAGFADYDRDGDLDCYVVTNILNFAVSPQGTRDYLMRNEGDGTFADVTGDSGIWGKTQGHTAIWFDSNQDGWPDVYVANDFETPDRFYLNNGDGTFIDVVDERLPHVTYFSMGADSGDLNNDGLVDYFVADMRDRTRQEFVTGMEEMGRGLWDMERVPELIPQYMWNALYLNAGNDRYKETAHMAGLEATGWTWATRMADFDNDGLLDLFFTNGMIRNFVDADLVDRQNIARSLAARAAVWKNAPLRNEPNLLYRNKGDLTFEDKTESWGLHHEGISFGCVVADMDGDGDLDIVYSNYNAPPTFVRNDIQSGGRFVVELQGKAPNLHAIGAEIVIETQAGSQLRQIYTERGIVSSEPAQAVFGLGDGSVIDRLVIRWPRGQKTVLEDLPANMKLLVSEPELDQAVLNPAIVESKVNPNALFLEAAGERGLEYVTELKPFDELSRQRMLPRRLNGQGPGLTTGDVNKDGIADVFVTGAAGKSGRLYLGNGDGTYAVAESQPWTQAQEADDIEAIFIDVNGDGAEDLYIAAGGVSSNRGDALLNDRLYFNDGEGAFSLAPEGTISADGEVTGALAKGDFDGDGKLDLFVGGRFVPGSWPEEPRSFLLSNKDGRLLDVTKEWIPNLNELGMVTDAVAEDIDGDGRVDLIVSTDFGPVKVFRNTGKQLLEETEERGLAAYTGWWNALALEDLNGDGRLDIVAGNVGLNTKYHASMDEPTVAIVGDFNDELRTHIVEAQYVDGKLYPMRGRSKLAYSFPWIAEKYKTYEDFSHATIEDIFDPIRLERTQRLEATELGSGIFYQQADGSFSFARLPAEAQAAPIHTITVGDFNSDGTLDFYCAGNDFGPEPSTGRFDGGLGVLLLGDGAGDFESVWPSESGISVSGEARSAVLLPASESDRLGLLVARTSGPLFFFVPQE